jgi:hypothetical protein
MAEPIKAATKKSKLLGEVPATKLQREAEALSGDFSSAIANDKAASKPFVSPMDSEESLASKNAGKYKVEDLKLQEEMKPNTLEVIGASIGGVTQDLVRAVLTDKGKEDLDPSWDIGDKRKEFRSKYEYDLWDSFENTKNKSQYDALEQSIADQRLRDEVQGSAPITSIAASIADPLGWFTGGAYVKGATLAAKAYGIGKYSALGGAAIAEGSTYASAEYYKQKTAYGAVIDDRAVATSFLLSAGVAFGISAATMRKSAFTNAAKQPTASEAILTPQPAQKIAPSPLSASPESLADDLIETSRRDLAKIADTKAKELMDTPPVITKAVDDIKEPSLVIPIKPVAPEGAWFTGSKTDLVSTRSLDEQIARQEAKGTGRNATEDFAGAGNYIALDSEFSQTYAKGGKVYSIEKPFEKPFDLMAKGNAKVYADLTKQAGSKSKANKLLQEQGYDAITFTDNRGNKLANMFNAKPVAFFKEGRKEAVKGDVQLSLEPVDNAIADAGSAANKSRQESQTDLLIEPKSDSTLDIIEHSFNNVKAARDELGKDFDYADSAAGQLSAKFSNFHKGMQSKSDVVKSFMLQVAEDATGIYRKSTMGAAVDKARFNNVIRSHYGNVHDEYVAYAKRTGQQFSAGRVRGTVENEFNVKLRAEMEARDALNGLDKADIDAADIARWKTTDPEVRRAADHLDAGNQAAAGLMKTHGMDGVEGLAGRRGYIPRRLDGRKLSALHAENPAKMLAYREAFAERVYKDLSTKQQQLITDGVQGIRLISKEKASTIANGMINRAIDRAAGIDGSTIALFDRAGREEISQILKAAGADDTDIRFMFQLLDKKLGSSPVSARLKGRLDIDIATPDAKTGINFSDFYDNDLNRLMTGYAEEMSGRIALTRVGIKSDNDFENIVRAVVAEGKTLDAKADVELLKDVYSQMLGRALPNQGTNKAVQLLTQVNPLQVLGQVGAAQLSESGLAVARLGIGTLLKSVPMMGKLIFNARKNLLNADDVKLLKDIEAWNGAVGEHWRTHRPSTDVMEQLNAHGEIAHMTDRLLKSGQQVNGFLSLMNQVMEAQLKTIAVSATRTFAKEIKAGVLTKRLADAGFSEGTMKRFAKEFEKNAIYKNGELVDMQLSKWDAANAFDFTRNIERISAQLVQRDFVGETASWMHKDVGRLFMSLRGYSIKAFNKQLVRNVKIADAVTAQSFIYGAAFSTLGYTAKAHVVSLGRDDREEFLEERLSGNNFALGVIGYMALGSFGTEILRPVASWAGESGDAGAVRASSDIATAILPGLSPLVKAGTFLSNVGNYAVDTALDQDATWSASKTRQAVGTVAGNSWLVAIPLNYALDDE